MLLRQLKRVIHELRSYSVPTTSYRLWDDGTDPVRCGDVLGRKVAFLFIYSAQREYRVVFPGGVYKKGEATLYPKTSPHITEVL